jgi:hypothetical protein
MAAVGKKSVLHLNSRYVSDDANIWCVHGGKSKRVLENFIAQNVIALDMPGVRIQENTFENDNVLNKRILISEAIQEYYKSLRKWRKGEPVPTRPSIKIDDYNTPTSRRDLYRLSYKKRSIERFFKQISVGDVVLTPSASSYEPFLFGFVKSDPNDFSTRTITEYPEDPVPALDVEWIDHAVSKRDIPSRVSRLMERRDAVSQIQQIEGPGIYTAVLGSYRGDSLFGVDVRCPLYRGNNPLETVPVQEIIAALTAVYGVYQDEGSEGLKDKTYDDLIRNYYDEEFIQSLENEFHSPGYYRVLARSGVLGLLLLVAPPLATSTDLDPKELDKVELADATAKQKKIFEELIKPMLKHMNPETTSKIVEHAKRAQEDMRAGTNAKIKKK